MRNIILKFIPGILLLFLWEYVASHDKSVLFFFSSPSKVISLLLKELQNANMWHNIGVTFIEASLGLIIGTLLGTIVGLLIWVNDIMRKMLEPYLLILGAIPIFALAPLLIIWFGIGLMSKVFMAAFSVFLVALAQSYDGTKNAAEKYTLFTESLGISRMKMMYKIILPGSLQWILSGLKMNIGLALLGAFIGEFVSSTAGLGFYILREGSLFNTAGVLVGIILLTCLSFFFNLILDAIKKYLLPWVNYQKNNG